MNTTGYFAAIPRGFQMVRATARRRGIDKFAACRQPFVLCLSTNVIGSPCPLCNGPSVFGNEALNGVDEVAVLVKEGVVNMVGFNVFRGETLNNITDGNLAVEFVRKTEANPVPMYLSEFAPTSTPEADTQADQAEYQWNRAVAPAVREDLMIGAFFMTWQDERWKSPTEEFLGMVTRTPTGFIFKKVYDVFKNLWSTSLLLILLISSVGLMNHSMLDHVNILMMNFSMSPWLALLPVAAWHVRREGGGLRTSTDTKGLTRRQVLISLGGVAGLATLGLWLRSATKKIPLYIFIWPTQWT
jgi:hypothetical protein